MRMYNMYMYFCICLDPAKLKETTQQTICVLFWLSCVHHVGPMCYIKNVVQSTSSVPAGREQKGMKRTSFQGLPA